VAWTVADKPAEDTNILWDDLNADGIVDDQDVAILFTNVKVGQDSPEAYILGDINMDGTIDLNDVKAVNAHRNRKADWYTEGATN
jgi:hypothetical protein